MKIVIQRVKSASVKVDDEIIGEISQGLLLYVCHEVDDGPETLKNAVEKIINLRIFEDQDQKMNLNIQQVKGQILSISQFTLSWDGRKGHRPSFDLSMPPAQAQLSYHTFNKMIKDSAIEVQTGKFGAEMMVSSINDGPVTFHLSF